MGPPGSRACYVRVRPGTTYSSLTFRKKGYVRLPGEPWSALDPLRTIRRHRSFKHPAVSKAPELADLRRYAIARSLFKPTTLMRAISRLGFVQADPIRAPARA